MYLAVQVPIYLYLVVQDLPVPRGTSTHLPEPQPNGNSLIVHTYLVLLNKATTTLGTQVTASTGQHLVRT